LYADKKMMKEKIDELSQSNRYKVKKMKEDCFFGCTGVASDPANPNEKNSALVFKKSQVLYRSWTES
jgi:hypothetical protein